MPPEHFTILVLSSEKSRFHKLKLSRRAVIAIAAAFGITLFAAGFVTPSLLMRLTAAGDTVDRLSADNRRLTEEQEAFEGSVSALSGRLDRFEAAAGRLAEELGVEGLGIQAAVGGESPTGGRGATVLDQELSSLRHRTASLDESLALLDEQFQERRRLLASTPDGMPVEGWFSHGFGWRKDPWTGEREFHRGMDIVAHTGTPIVATGDGVISRATRKSDYGKMIDISHGYGYVSRYAHLSEILVRPGQRIQRGDVIGRVGSTGRSTGPHLHYEIFRDDRRVNPWKYLGQKGR